MGDTIIVYKILVGIPERKEEILRYWGNLSVDGRIGLTLNWFEVVDWIGFNSGLL
jgi:hypothetical protein